MEENKDKWLSIAEVLLYQELMKQQQMEMLPDWVLKFCGATYTEYNREIKEVFKYVFKGKEYTEHEFKSFVKEIYGN